MTVSIGERRHLLTLENPGVPAPDGDGGVTQPWTALQPPQVWAAIVPATARALERVAAGTVLSTASHIVTFRHHPQVTTKTRVTKGLRAADGSLAVGAREFSITGLANPEERGIDLVCVCVEVVP